MQNVLFLKFWLWHGPARLFILLGQRQEYCRCSLRVLGATNGQNGGFQSTEIQEHGGELNTEIKYNELFSIHLRHIF